MSKAIVIFSDNTGVWWLKFLKAGFRHCFVILETDRGPFWVDPLSRGLTIKPLANHELEGLMHWYRDMGFRVIQVEITSAKNKPFCWGPMTCVEVIKRLIGLHDWRVITPWQLYHALKKEQKTNKKGIKA